VKDTNFAMCTVCGIFHTNISGRVFKLSGASLLDKHK